MMQELSFFPSHCNTRVCPETDVREREKTVTLSSLLPFLHWFTFQTEPSRTRALLMNTTGSLFTAGLPPMEYAVFPYYLIELRKLFLIV